MAWRQDAVLQSDRTKLRQVMPLGELAADPKPHVEQPELPWPMETR